MTNTAQSKISKTRTEPSLTIYSKFCFRFTSCVFGPLVGVQGAVIGPYNHLGLRDALAFGFFYHRTWSRVQIYCQRKACRPTRKRKYLRCRQELGKLKVHELCLRCDYCFYYNIKYKLNHKMNEGKYIGRIGQ